MLNYLLTTCLFLTVSTGIFAFPFNDQDGKINQKDANGLKQGRWVYFGKTSLPKEFLLKERLKKEVSKTIEKKEPG